MSDGTTVRIVMNGMNMERRIITGGCAHRGDATGGVRIDMIADLMRVLPPGSALSLCSPLTTPLRR